MREPTDTKAKVLIQSIGLYRVSNLMLRPARHTPGNDALIEWAMSSLKLELRLQPELDISVGFCRSHCKRTTKDNKKTLILASVLDTKTEESTSLLHTKSKLHRTKTIREIFVPGGGALSARGWGWKRTGVSSEPTALGLGKDLRLRSSRCLRRRLQWYCARSLEKNGEDCVEKTPDSSPGTKLGVVQPVPDQVVATAAHASSWCATRHRH